MGLWKCRDGGRINPVKHRALGGPGRDLRRGFQAAVRGSGADDLNKDAFDLVSAVGKPSKRRVISTRALIGSSGTPGPEVFDQSQQNLGCPASVVEGDRGEMKGFEQRNLIPYG